MVFKLGFDISATGFYTWDIANNCLWGDAVIAMMFGFAQEHIDQGVPLEDYINRLHPDDRSFFVQNVKEAVITGSLFQMSYRLLHRETEFTVVDIGRCFRYSDGLPLLFTGMVVQRPCSRQVVGNSNVAVGVLR